MIIDLKTILKSAKNLSPIGDLLVQHCGWSKDQWNNVSISWPKVNGDIMEKTYGAGEFMVTRNGDDGVFHRFSLKKTDSLILDTDQQLIIVDGFIAIDVGARG